MLNIFLIVCVFPTHSTSSCCLQRSQASKEAIEQQLNEKLQILQELRKEALELEKQIEKQKREIGKNQKELEDLQSSLGSVNPEDPRHVSKTRMLHFYILCNGVKAALTGDHSLVLDS